MKFALPVCAHAAGQVCLVRVRRRIIPARKQNAVAFQTRLAGAIFSEKPKGKFRGIANGVDEATLCADIAGMVAAMTEGDPAVASEKASCNALG